MLRAASEEVGTSRALLESSPLILFKQFQVYESCKRMRKMLFEAKGKCRRMKSRRGIFVTSTSIYSTLDASQYCISHNGCLFTQRSICFRQH